jgi:hypothetical protein
MFQHSQFTHPILQQLLNMDPSDIFYGGLDSQEQHAKHFTIGLTI